MATVKKGTLTHSKGLAGWWRHLRAKGKRKFWKVERRTAQLVVRKETNDASRN